MNQITKEQAVSLFGTPRQLAAALGITVHAIYMWGDGKPIPMPRQWQIRLLRPDAFDSSGQLKAPAGEAKDAA